ncbi:sensor histidine kinase [Actomonas aquatica]|uniref:Histidine kinase n=1 Tax=Actomonas aquatica TaxID=2866162 RepID=A0ABZ1CCS5_9BACT|nr:histidine kinase [Opitutus sp. WL0086]WRQ89474.1 histidine kinase [Opitutus sp. WL0086]
MDTSPLNSLLTLRPVTSASHPARRRWIGPPAYWGMQAAGWGGYFLLSISSLLVERGEGAALDVQDSLAMVVFGVLTTHLLRVWLIAIRRRRHSGFGFAWRLLLCAVAGGWALGGAMSWVSINLLPREGLALELIESAGPMTDYLEMVTRSIFFVGVWLALYFGTHVYFEYQEGLRERLRLQSIAREAELAALKAQLNPHFLFNSLNTIRALIPRDLDRPRDAVTSLSELLRTALQQGTVEHVSLAMELGMVEHYLSLEHLRHEKRLTVERDFSPDALRCEVPPFALQTLVENAINHGIAQRRAGGTVALSAHLRDDRLEIRVTNPGCLGAGSTSTGVGLTNVRARLELLWGSAASLEVVQAAPDQVVATLLMPARIASLNASA